MAVEPVISRLQLNVALKAVGDTVLSSRCWCRDSRSFPWLRLSLGGCNQAGWFWLTRSVPFRGTLLLGHGEDSLNRGSTNYLIVTSKSMFYSHGHKGEMLCIGTSFVYEGKDVPRFFCTPRSLSCLEVAVVRCEDRAAPCQAHYLCARCESCLQAESVPSTLSHIKGAILGLAVKTFIALLNTSWLFISMLQLPSSDWNRFWKKLFIFFFFTPFHKE